MGNFLTKDWQEHKNEDDSMIKSSNVVAADTDPRSPSVGIVRTPILFFDDKNGKSSVSSDPRSPTADLSRTPVNFKDKGNDNQMFELSMEGSTASDSSFLLQQVPEANSSNKKENKSESSPDRYVISSKSLSSMSSNLPRHIIQRKQMEKINKKKFQNLDKENNIEYN